jgi:ligand-binding sensor domain-containing protein
MLSADQLAHQALPGGGFDTGAWRVWSSVHHPIPSSYIHALQFAPDGTAWVATDAGLVRFRPNAAPAEQWFTYTPANSPLLIPGIRSIAIDSQGNVWIANAAVNVGGRGLFELKPATNQWTHVQPGLRAWNVAIGENDQVLVSMTGTSGLMKFDGTNWTHWSHPFAFEELSGMVQDTQGHVWAMTAAGYLTKWNGASWQMWGQIGDTNTMTGIGQDLSGAVYVSSWNGGVFKMVNDAPVFVFDAQALPSAIVQRPNGDFWVKNYGANGIFGTVRQYSSSGQLLRRINTYNSGLPDYFITRMKGDSGGNMWFASPEGGLSRLQGSNGSPDAATKWRNWGNHNYAAEPYPWAGSEPMYTVFEDENGIYWMGGNGICRWNSATGSFTGFWNWQNSNLGGHNINAIVKRAGTVWAGTGGSGVFWFDGTNWNNVTLSPGGYSYSPNNVKAMTVDTAGDLWVASEYGLRRFAAGNNAGFTVYHNANSPLPSSYITDVEADPAGGVWVSTDSGLARFDGTTWTVYTAATSNLPGSLVTDVTRRASDGLIAISIQNGNVGSVSTFDGSNWTHYTTANSPLTHPQVQAVEFDRNGNLWASAYGEGVVQIMLGTPPLQMMSAVSRKTHGSGGNFDVELPLSWQAGVESRSGGGTGAHAIVFTLSNNIATASASVTAGSASVSGAPVISGNTIQVNLMNVVDAQTVTLSLSNVSDAFGQTLPGTTVTAGFLLGDTNGDRTVNAADALQTRSRSGQATDTANFRSDVNTDGGLNAGDTAIVRARSGGGLAGAAELH